ncbi:dipeptide epimerase [Halobacillus kuroshimensis]|uniref:Dipeptide epimerase n=1 Tax=Halobacillus kuroshimensis TaxID=302481 RepID=A0ABS3DSB1_9BACI|nr:dipeptide epimerase [Halobacillus kuroshimensis]MBN8234227.1 dipeptide epimerase [Halobacillus kuroshimensis]
MKIQSVETMRVAVPLHKPFITALRTVTVAESIYVRIEFDNGLTGCGEAPPTHVITGESLGGIENTIKEILTPVLIGSDILQREAVFESLHRSCVGNTSAKAAVDMALYDGLSQAAGLPLYQFLGGWTDQLETDYTVSVNTPEEMAEDADAYVQQGFRVLKVKVGKDSIHHDIERIQAIHQRIGKDAVIRLDANQAWTAKEAVYAIREMENRKLPIELVEQPVKAGDIDGLKMVTDAVSTVIMADESVFSPEDAIRMLKTGSADMINIKLMKSGGIHKALKINAAAESFGVPCMVGSMIETKLGITAAAHFAASQKNVTKVDFDAPLMLTADPVEGGVHYNQAVMTLPKTPGLGISRLSLKNTGIS